jgi:membrane protease YdiL (CAAX protease family)
VRSFTSFAGLIAAGLLAIVLLAYPAWTVLNPVLGVPFHRVASRVGMIVLLVGFVLVARRLALADRVSLGYGLPRRQFLRESSIALALGVATMLPIVVAMVVLDLRDLKSGVVLDAATLGPLIASGLGTGVAVALIEETFMRGAMFTGIARESGERAAIWLTSLLYAAAHFIGKYRIPAEQLGPGSGLDLLAGSFAAFGDPMRIADAFLTFLAVGVLLGVVRARTGNIAACLGLHAGWVWVISVVRETSSPDASHPLAFLLSRFDGVVGWMILGWAAVIGAVLLRVYARRSNGAMR